jgi:hypothetical protein
VSDHITLYDITLQEKEKIYTHWNSTGVLIKHKKINDKISRAILSALKDYSSDEIKSAIDNYEAVISDPSKYFFTYQWGLKDFLSRGLEKFLTSANPLTNFLKDKTRPSSQEPDWEAEKRKKGSHE